MAGALLAGFLIPLQMAAFACWLFDPRVVVLPRTSGIPTAVVDPNGVDPSVARSRCQRWLARLTLSPPLA